SVNSLAEENYLKALFNLSNETGVVNVNELSKHLNIKMPTVTSMMKKLASKKLVHYESYKPLKLTKEGRKQAAAIIRKHRLTEMFLVKKMGFGWEQVHDIAEQIEHIQSPLFFEKMDELLEYPKFDPHGSPIPDKDGNMNWKEYSKLSDCAPGEQALVGFVILTILAKAVKQGKEKPAPSKLKLILFGTSFGMTTGTLLATNIFFEAATINWKGIALGMLAASSYTVSIYSSSNVET
ncbi:iron dependent repressor, DNA binding domain protein, partial [Ancylostoma ceylanicum]